ncbi:MAG: NAD(P)/FAD-dependent oxidoreductase [Myxococcales bacterium]
MPLVYNPTQNHVSEVLIVGGGPVGLFGALCAAKRGLAVTVLDRGFRGYSRGHATLLHPATLRLMSEYGLNGKLLAAGRAIGRVELRLDDDFWATLDLPSPALTVAQSAFEEILLKALQTEDVEIESPWEATSLVQTSDGVDVHATRRELVPFGSPTLSKDWQPVESSQIHARFVIGADGRESSVRSSLGIETLTAGEREKFAMFEGRRAMPREDFALSFSNGLASVALPLSGEAGRWGFQIAEDSKLVPNLEQLRTLLEERASFEPELPDELHWSTVTHFDRRLARRFGHGRVWLAGDAAHVTSPFGGQSVNGGLLEVHELVETMASCLRANGALAELDQISARREREWHKLLGIESHLEVRPGLAAPLTRYAHRILPALPASGRDLQYLLSQLGYVSY